MSSVDSQSPTRVLIQRIVPPYKLDLIERLAEEFDLFVIHAREARRATVFDVGDMRSPHHLTWRVYVPRSESVVFLGGLVPTLRLHPRTVVLEGSLGVLTNYVYLFFKRLFGIRVVLWTFGFDPAEGAIGTGLKDCLRLWMYRRSDAIIVYSYFSRAMLVESERALEAKTFVALNVVGSELTRQGRHTWRNRSAREARQYLGLEDSDLDRSTVVFVGRLIQEKRVEVLIEAVSKLRRQGKDLCCYIVGDGPERTCLEILSQQLEIGDVVHFAGHVYPREAAAWFAAADIVAVPGRLGLVVSHAAAFGAPVLSVQREGFHGEGAEFLVEGITGWWCDSYEGYAAALDKRLDDREGLDAVKRECIEYSQRHLTEDETVKGFGAALRHAERQLPTECR